MLPESILFSIGNDINCNAMTNENKIAIFEFFMMVLLFIYLPYAYRDDPTKSIGSARYKNSASAII